MIIQSLIPKQCPELFKVCAAFDQPIPIVVSDFVPEMSEQGSIRFTMSLSLHFAVDIVRFRHVDGDEAVIVAGEHTALVPIGVHAIA